MSTEISSSDLSTRIASLERLLLSLDRARQSLPTLLRSISSTNLHHSSSLTPTTTNTRSQIDLSLLYKASSNEAWSSIRSLGEALLTNESILVQAEQSRSIDSYGIGVKVRDQEKGRSEVWEQLNRLEQIYNQRSGPGMGMGEPFAKRVSMRNRLRKGRLQKEETSLRSPTSKQELVDLLHEWKVRHRDRIQLLHLVEGEGTLQEPVQIRFVRKGLMNAFIDLHWRPSTKDQSVRIAQVERISCFGLKENSETASLRKLNSSPEYYIRQKSPYLQSQYTLFQTMTRSAMELIELAAIQRDEMREPVGIEEESELENVLMFLTDPPLPF